MPVREPPPDVIRQMQDCTGAPWWNGRAYAEIMGLPQAIRRYEQEIGYSVDDLYDLMEWLRAERQFAQADRLRTILGRLARSLPPPRETDRGLIRTIARGYPDPAKAD